MTKFVAMTCLSFATLSVTSFSNSQQPLVAEWVEGAISLGDEGEASPTEASYESWLIIGRLPDDAAVQDTSLRVLGNFDNTDDFVT